MESRMYLWEETYENIWDSCPRPESRKRPRRTVRAKQEEAERNADDNASQPHPRCICAAGGATEGWRGRLREVVGVLEMATASQTSCPQHLIRTVKDHLDKGLCCCHRKCVHRVINMPVDEFEQNIWDLYTFFLNGINIVTDALQVTDVSNKECETQTPTKCHPDHINLDQISHNTNEPEHRTQGTTNPLSTAVDTTTSTSEDYTPEVHSPTINTSNSSNTLTSTSTDVNATRGDANMADSSQVAANIDESSSPPPTTDETGPETNSESVEVKEVVFQNSIAQLVEECVAYKDVHRYILLTELRTLFMLFAQSLYYNSCAVDEETCDTQTADWLDR